MHKINSDEYILDTFKSDNEKGFRLLLLKYRERLYFHIRRILILHEDSDDALQNTFIKVWENLEKFKGASTLYTWIYRIATNEALLILQKRKREKKYSSSDIESFFSTSAESDIWFDGDEIYRRLLGAILELPEKQQIVFNMRYFDQVKYEEMSEILSTSTGALKASYHLARKKIEEKFKLD